MVKTVFKLTPRKVLLYFFGTNNKEEEKLLLNYFEDLNYENLANHIRMISSWNSVTETKEEKHALKIHATNDVLLPIAREDSTLILNEGGHFAIMSCAEEISDFIGRELRISDEEIAQQ